MVFLLLFSYFWIIVSDIIFIYSLKNAYISNFLNIGGVKLFFLPHVNQRGESLNHNYLQDYLFCGSKIKMYP